MLSGILGIVLLAAIAGVAYPYFPKWSRLHFLGVAIGAVVLITVVGSSSDKSEKNNVVAANEAAAVEPAPPVTEAPPEPQPPQTKWSYTEDKDEMRGHVSKFAVVTSDNQVNLDFPYGEVYGRITVRKRPRDGLNIMFGVDSGQILCRSYGDTTYISVKFDNNPIKRYSCTESSSGGSDMVFINGESSFLSSLKKSKKTIIEAEFYQQGNQQFVFQTSGLNWK